MKYDYRKYTYRIRWSEEDKAHLGSCLEFPSLMTHGKTAEEALKEIEKVVKVTLKWMEEDKETIPEPLGVREFKGHLTIRTSSEKHRELAMRSAEEGVSINQYVLSKL